MKKERISEEALREMLDRAEDKLQDVMLKGPRSCAILTDYFLRWAAMSGCLIAVDMTGDGELSSARELKLKMNESLDDNFTSLYEKFVEELKLTNAFDSNASLREELLRAVEPFEGREV